MTGQEFIAFFDDKFYELHFHLPGVSPWKEICHEIIIISIYYGVCKQLICHGFRVRDNGKRMTAEKVGQIFKPFFTDKNCGTGLGLAISRNIIEHHRGTIAVESKEGEGTTFTIVLPGS